MLDDVVGELADVEVADSVVVEEDVRDEVENEAGEGDENVVVKLVEEAEGDVDAAVEEEKTTVVDDGIEEAVEVIGDDVLGEDVVNEVNEEVMVEEVECEVGEVEEDVVDVSDDVEDGVDDCDNGVVEEDGDVLTVEEDSVDVEVKDVAASVVVGAVLVVIVVRLSVDSIISTVFLSIFRLLYGALLLIWSLTREVRRNDVLANCLYLSSFKNRSNDTFILPGLNVFTWVLIYKSESELFLIILSISDVKLFAVSIYNDDVETLRSACQVSVRSREPSNDIKSGRIVVWIS